MRDKRTIVQSTEKVEGGRGRGGGLRGLILVGIGILGGGSSEHQVHALAGWLRVLLLLLLLLLLVRTVVTKEVGLRGLLLGLREVHALPIG